MNGAAAGTAIRMMVCDVATGLGRVVDAVLVCVSPPSTLWCHGCVVVRLGLSDIAMGPEEYADRLARAVRADWYEKLERARATRWEGR